MLWESIAVRRRERMRKMSTKSYSELSMLRTFDERFEYLKLLGVVGEETFGRDRYLNQLLYRGKRWKLFRNKIIIRDMGCDLGLYGYDIYDYITVHHINPITVDDILNDRKCVYDFENSICTSEITHKAIHYSNEFILFKPVIDRFKNDTCPWRKY